MALSNLGRTYTRSGETGNALGYDLRALLIHKAVGNLIGEARTLNNMMVDWVSLNNDRMAIFYGKKSLNKLQKLRGEARGFDNETQKLFLKEINYTYKNLAELLIRNRKIEQSVQVLNLYQDQQFFDFNHDMNSSIRQVALTPHEQEFDERHESAVEKIGQINSQIDELKRQIGDRQPNQQETAQFRELELELKSATDTFLSILDNVAEKFAKPLDATDKVATVPEVAGMQTTLRELGTATKQKTAALYMLIGDNKFHIILITSDGIKNFESPIKADDLNKKLLGFHALLQSPTYDPRPLGKDLYDIIFKPVEAELKKADAQTLMWQLDGSLRYVPMAALFDGEKYLVERYQNVVFTRADKGRMTRPVSPVWTGYGFATSAPYKVKVGDRQIEFSPLDFVKDEMHVFRTNSYSKGIINGEVFFEDKFTKASLLMALKQKRPLVHISSHFRFDPGDASGSFLLLGDGNIMTLAEMKEHASLFAGVELLTLSACDTAAQLPDANGREIDTFAELAQRLGAGGVMASLWAVTDRSTAELMKGLYKNRIVGKFSKAEALRRAQLDLLYGEAENPAVSASPELKTVRRGNPIAEAVFVEEKYRIPFKPDKKKPFAHPYYWSPFILFGNWR